MKKKGYKKIGYGIHLSYIAFFIILKIYFLLQMLTSIFLLNYLGNSNNMLDAILVFIDACSIVFRVELIFILTYFLPPLFFNFLRWTIIQIEKYRSKNE